MSMPKKPKTKGSGRLPIVKQGQLGHKLTRRYRRWRTTPRARRLSRYVSRPKFGKYYLLLCLIALLLTTVFWTVLGTRLQQNNADQLVNAYLFQNGATFHGAAFPGQHSFLLKWPLFYLVKLLGYSPASFIGVTLATVLVTIALFIFILSRIERRPLVLGTLCLLLASVLLMVPAQPYAGALLPVNMAMLTTRNLEYVLYIAGIFYVVTAKHFRSKQFLAAVALLAVLFASDKLFFDLSLSGALLALLVYSLRGRWKLVSLSARWLVASLCAVLGAVISIAFINHAHITHVTNDTAGPYGLTASPKALALGVIYALSGLLTNFGANPAYNAPTLRHIPDTLFHNLLTVGGPAYVFNLLFFMAALIVGVRFLLGTFGLSKSKVSETHAASRLSIILAWASIAAIGLFIVTNHYYRVDARYLTIYLFALFVMLATWFRGRRLDPEFLVCGLPFIALSIICGVFASAQTYNTQQQAFATVQHRNMLVAQVIARHHVSVLAGDYWRVLPIKLLDDSRQTVLPLAQCTQPRPVLTSQAWQLDLHRASFAYLLTLDGNLTDYPDCSLRQIDDAYGAPNSSVLIDGSLLHPKELLLFYDKGINQSSSKTTAAVQTTSTILPIALSDVAHTSCSVPAVINIVAHQDDDLLFMNPDILHDITAGYCVRTIYLTAGDAGGDKQYWLSRELGSEAAYSEMTGANSVWIQQIVRLPGGQFVTIANPQDNNKISLIFMHLPDGNLHGQGFSASNYESLAKLAAGNVSRLHTVDHQSSYSANQLTVALVDLLHTYQPAEIRTQSNYAGDRYTDHSDHRTTGQFVTQAYHMYESEQYGGYVTIPLTYYIGYPIRQFAPDVSGQDLTAKDNAFIAYAHFDGSVCATLAICQQTPTYASYLVRQYKSAY
jgi:LmbE family N-acetylglucosaminyl deacetylase